MKNSDDENNEATIEANDELVLTVESLNARNKILTSEKEDALRQVEHLKHVNEQFECQLKVKKSDMEKKVETHRKFSNMQNKVEEDLRREIGVLNQKLSSTIAGHQAESQMYEEALVKVKFNAFCISNYFI